MKRLMSLLIVICLLILLPTEICLADEVLCARYPALSPDGGTVAFSYMGDIWTASSSGGTASRLTVHEGDDVRPHFSPDGNYVMFSSRRYNNYDVFVIPVSGGNAKQLTFHSAADFGSGWFPEGDSILFTSLRDGWRDIFKISIDGGIPIKLTGYPYEQEYNGRITPDRKYLIYNIGSGNSRWWRRDLKSSGNADIYFQDRSKEDFTSIRLTDYDNHDVWPIYNSITGEVYFASCRGDWSQVYRIKLGSLEPIQLTQFTNDGVQWLNSNPQGNLLVFEQGLKIWMLDPSDGTPREIPITVSTDEKDNLLRKRTFQGDAEWFSLSPDEKKLAVIVHGEVFVLPADEPKKGKRVTRTPNRERFVVWGDDSRTVYYASDRYGNYDIFSADVLTGVERRLTSTAENEAKPAVSPDGRYLAFYRGLDKIIRYDLKEERETVWMEGIFFDLAVEPTFEYAWSADSKWLVATVAGPTYETDIVCIDLDGNVRDISNLAGWNFRPRFSIDGKQIYFSSASGDRIDTYKVDLVREQVEFIESSFDSLFSTEDKKIEKNTGETLSQEPANVAIDFERIEMRRARAYSLEGSSHYPVLTPDSKKYILVASLLGKPDIWSINSEGDAELKQLTHSGKAKSQLTVTSDSKAVFYLEDEKLQKCDIESGEVTPMPFEADMEIDLQQNNRQKFNEAWSLLNTYFYDGDFHGSDWEAARLKYEPAVDHVRTEREFRHLLLELMGELRASHLDVYSKLPGPDKNIASGNTGISLDYAALDRDGVFMIDAVLPESPAYMAGIKPGQYIRSIDGQAVSSDINIFRNLAGTEDQRLSLVVSDRSDDQGREVFLKPAAASYIDDLVYADWVASRRRAVDSLSGGRLAYLHIRAMSQEHLDIFEQELVSIAEPKDGLVIDVRNNFGGNIAVHLLGILVKTPYLLRDFRGFPTTSENKMRSKAFERPMTLLINNYSASNSEIFAEGFRDLELGKIVGVRTAGAVIGTASFSLIDGTGIRRPSWGAYTTEMEDTEVFPRQPDILVENLPDDYINGRDPQLVRAVEELMKKLD